MPLIEGRDFRSTDDRKAPAVAVVNQALADRYFPDGAAIGKQLWMGGRKGPAHGDRRRCRQRPHRRPDAKPPEPEVYFSLWQSSAFSKDLVVRTRPAEPRAVMAAVRRELHAVDPTAAVENMRTLDDIRGESLASRTFAMRLLVGFAGVASVLTLVGIYGVLSLSVAARRREIAIRAAVGAGPARHPPARPRRGFAADCRRHRLGHRRGRRCCRACCSRSSSRSARPIRSRSRSWACCLRAWRCWRAGCRRAARPAWIRWKRCAASSSVPAVRLDRLSSASRLAGPARRRYNRRGHDPTDRCAD